MNRSVSRILRISRTVSHLEQTAAFYCDALGFQFQQELHIEDPAAAVSLGLPTASARVMHLGLGEQQLELVAFDKPGKPYPTISCSSDLWFQHFAVVVADMPTAYAHLCAHDFAPISAGGPVALPENTGGVTAFKFRDPEGHPLELLCFPPGVGDARWQRQDGLFLGIDHTAIAVADASASVSFYTQLGFRITSRSRNRGVEQQRLDHLSAPDADVIGLQPALDGPPHLELLAYRRPRGATATMAWNDIAADRTVMEADDVAAPRTKALPADGAFRPGSNVLQDPDGHFLTLLQSVMH